VLLNRQPVLGVAGVAVQAGDLPMRRDLDAFGVREAREHLAAARVVPHGGLHVDRADVQQAPRWGFDGHAPEARDVAQRADAGYRLRAMAARVTHLDQLDRVDVAGVHLRPVRRPLGISAFGINGFTADAGEQLIEDHDEAGSGGSGHHEELYLVVGGHATFTVAGQEIDAPAGTLVFVAEPGDRRSAVAVADGTQVLVIGGPPGAAGPISPWEWYFGAAAHANAGDWRGAYDFAAQGLTEHPDHPSLHYNLACYAAMAGMRDAALDHLRRAVEQAPEMREWAATDTDLDPIRDDPGFPA
jgi:tetratricopeptide (TPR) repeat protein